ncbi:hypothetical protein ACSMXN_07500 [Jatrophihabitans sp. DSM 45814]
MSAPNLYRPAHGYADLVERMFHEFEDQHQLVVIRKIVAECQSDLMGEAGSPALPELLERLARQRLSNLPRTRDR